VVLHAEALVYRAALVAPAAPRDVFVHLRLLRMVIGGGCSSSEVGTALAKGIRCRGHGLSRWHLGAIAIVDLRGATLDEGRLRGGALALAEGTLGFLILIRGYDWRLATGFEHLTGGSINVLP
jgi:hypothetical protein